jgi:hypothetical protein
LFTTTQILIVLGLAAFAIVAALAFSRFAAANEETMREIRDTDQIAPAPKPVKQPTRPKRRR